jgi:hypothetical protein
MPQEEVILEIECDSLGDEIWDSESVDEGDGFDSKNDVLRMT